MLLASRYKIVPVFFLMTFLSLLPAAHASETSESGDRRGLVVNRETQRLSGLQTTALQLSQYQPEFIAYGIVQDMQPLLEMRNLYFAAQAAKNINAAHLQQTQQNLARLNKLYRADIIAQSKLQSQQAQWHAEMAQADADRKQLAAIRARAQLQWGSKLADWAFSDASSPILTPNYKLLLVTLPPERSLSDPSTTVRIHRYGDRALATEADFISAAPQTDGTFQGETYFFSSVDGTLRIGMRVTVWIAQAMEGQQGVIIPSSAVVWHLGQAYVYIQTDSERFERRAMDISRPAAAGYFVKHRFASGERVVVSGAQMLLSEEFRTQIPDEDDD
ncbi:MAG: efflux RND transporter periplasmic adaptor subunit [Gammaproteobacteria bacterium]